MKQRYLLWTALLLFSALAAGGCASARVKGNIYKKGPIDLKTAKFAVLPFNSASSGKTMSERVSTDGNAIADILTIEMLFKGYQVLERDKVRDIFKEVVLSQSITIMSDDPKKISEMGKYLGVDYIVYGSVIQYDFQLAKGGMLSGGGGWKTAVGISARVVDVKSATVVMICTASQSGSDLAEALGGISQAFTNALSEEKIYVWQ